MSFGFILRPYATANQDDESYDVERDLAFSGLQEFSRGCNFKQDLTLFGCVTYRPGVFDGDVADLLTEEHVVGTVGLSFDEEAMLAWAGLPVFRDLLGKILQSLPGPIRVWSKTSREWALHYGISAEVGGHPAWLASVDLAEQLLECSIPYRRVAQVAAYVVDEIGFAFACAVASEPFIIQVPPTARARIQPQGSHVLVQFAQEYGCQSNVVYTDGELTERLKSPVEPIALEVVAQAQAKARATLQEILQAYEGKPDTSTVLTNAFDAVGAPPAPGTVAPPGVKPLLSLSQAGEYELNVGAVFDPAQYYPDSYFGKGIKFTKADGQKDTYYGPSHQWDGFDFVARAIFHMQPEHRDLALLDLGCGRGDFVARARKAGFAARGIDLSAEALRGAPREVEAHLLAGDLTNTTVLAFLHRAKYDVVTAWDFWEHIYETDADKLIDAVATLLPQASAMYTVTCTRGNGEKDFVHPRGGVVTTVNSWALVSGHVNIRTWNYWVERFARHGLKPRYDLQSRFLAALAEEPTMRTILSGSWSPRHVLVVGK